MKKMKKLFAILMTMAMVMGLGITGFAAQDSATITVNGLNEGATIKYLQVVEPDTSSPIGWKFSGDNDPTIANAFKTAFKVSTDEAALNKLIDLVKNNDTGDASEGKLTSSADLSAALTALKSSATNTAGVNKNVITVSKAGLYIVVASTNDSTYTYVPMLAYVADNGEGDLANASVSAKGSHNEITKTITDQDGESVYAGDEIPYKATVEYPYYSEDTQDQTFWVKDKLTNATFKEGSVVVKVVGEDDPLVAGKDYTINGYAGTGSLEITFNYDLSKAGSTVEITYVAIAGDGNGVSNSINTNFDSDGDKVEVDQVQVEIKKIEKADGANKPLQGAVFTIYNVLTETAYNELDKTEQANYVKVENATLVNGEGQLQTNQTIYVDELKVSSSTKEDGTTTITGLDAQVGTYYIKETVAPSGYTLNEAYYQLTGASKNTTDSNNNKFVYNDFSDITVEDTKVSSLPETGGMGTTLFTIAGCVIMISAAGLFFATRKKAN